MHRASLKKQKRGNSEKKTFVDWAQIAKTKEKQTKLLHTWRHGSFQSRESDASGALAWTNQYISSCSALHVFVFWKLRAIYWAMWCIKANGLMWCGWKRHSMKEKASSRTSHHHYQCEQNLSFKQLHDLHFVYILHQSK